METKKILLAITILFSVFTISCHKERHMPGSHDDHHQDANNLSFTSLKAEKGLIGTKEETEVTATATGKDLQYNWKASAGKLLGQGHKVIFAGSHCCMGENKITCTVTDTDGNTLSKVVTIKVQ
jgi:hypothetical protein